MAIDQEKLEQLDEQLVCAMVSGRKRLGILGIVSLSTPSGEFLNHVLFYDFIQNEQEPLMPVGVIQLAQEILEVFGPWLSFFESRREYSAWSKQVDTEQPISPLSVARAFLCSTGKLQLPDSDVLVQQTLSQQSQDKSLGLGMSPELMESWLKWAIHEDEISRDYSRARNQLAQAIADSANEA